MPRTTEKKGTCSSLAINGGSPVREVRKQPQVRLKQDVEQEMCDLIKRGQFSAWYGGIKSHEFERDFAEYHGRKHAIAVNSGTSALHVAYAAIGISPGHEVILPSTAFVTVASAVLQLYGSVVIADIDPRTFVLDPASAEARMTPATRAIVPVHTYGHMVNMYPLMELADKYGIWIVEDCGQAHGAKQDGKLAGSFGHIACFSFAGRKHISCGEGGMVLTDDDALADRIRKLSNKGKGRGWMDHEMLGFSYTMTEFQAIVGIAQLRDLDDEVERRRRSAAAIRAGRLVSLGLELAQELPGFRHNYFKFPVLLPSHLAERRNWFVKALQAENIGVDPAHPLLYELPWIRQRAFVPLACPSQCRFKSSPVRFSGPDCPNSEATISRMFALETGPGLDEADMASACEAIRKVFAHLAR